MGAGTRAKVIGAGLVGLLLVAGGLWRSRQGHPRSVPSWVARVSDDTRAARPDILLVVYDARRRDDFSFGPHGGRRGDTPYLAAFAERALYFQDAVSPGCWTVPVHAALFSGLGVCELGNDYYNPGHASFPDYFLSLAEILSLAGYDTAALTDHPYFFNSRRNEALVRGFRQWDAVNDFTDFPFVTNIGTPGGAVERRALLEPRVGLEWGEVRETIERFNRGEVSFAGPDEVDREPETGVLLPRLERLFGDSSYFERRYRRILDEHVLSPPAARAPSSSS